MIKNVLKARGKIIENLDATERQNTVLLTGAAGFIGAKTAELLLENGTQVIGLDSLNTYYDVRLKKYRLNKLMKYDRFHFIKLILKKNML